MFIFKRKPAMPEEKLKELKNYIGKTVEVMLTTKEETINIIKKYDLVLIFSWEIDHFEGSIYQLSKFNLISGGMDSKANIPLYTEKRYFEQSNDSIQYIDDNEIRGLNSNNLKIFYSLCELIRMVEIEVGEHNQYRCVW